jgi:hypothetical protein
MAERRLSHKSYFPGNSVLKDALCHAECSLIVQLLRMSATSRHVQGRDSSTASGMQPMSPAIPFPIEHGAEANRGQYQSCGQGEADQVNFDLEMELLILDSCCLIIFHSQKNFNFCQARYLL